MAKILPAADVYIQAELQVINVELVLKRYETSNASEILSVETPNYFLNSTKSQLQQLKGTDMKQALSFTNFMKFPVQPNFAASSNELFLTPQEDYQLFYATIPNSVVSPILYIDSVTLNDQPLAYASDWMVLRTDFSGAYSNNKFYLLFASQYSFFEPGQKVTAKCVVAKNFLNTFNTQIAPLLPVGVVANAKVLPYIFVSAGFSSDAIISSESGRLINWLNSVNIIDVNLMNLEFPKVKSVVAVFVTPSFDYINILPASGQVDWKKIITPYTYDPENVRFVAPIELQRVV